MTMRTAMMVLALAGCGGDGSDGPVDAPGQLPDCMCLPDAPMFDPLAGIGPVERVDDGYMFTEGPQWREAERDLVFSDIPANTIFRYTPGGGDPVSFRNPSNNSNGLAEDPSGVLYAAEHGSRSVTRANTATPVASMFEGKRLNSPNDVVISDDGNVYFTDPPYGIPAGQSQELDFNGVFRVSPAGALTAVHRGALSARPNGIGLSPDGTTLYVADTADGNLYKFPLDGSGAPGERQMLATTQGGPDGLAIDSGGNIFVTTSGGVEVFSPTGQRWGNITVPMQPANCAFGDADHQTLYITARTGVYRVRLAHPGLPRR